MKYQKFELHTHTLHSDGKMQPEQLAKLAKLRGYDGFALTDHNTVSGVPFARKYAKNNDLFFVEGIEWTTFFGHITVLGGKTPVNWRDVSFETFDECAKKSREAGDAVVIAHPKRRGGVLCSGCYFDYEIKQWENISAMEVMTLTMPHARYENHATKQWWLSLLAEGKRIGAVYGYDWHEGGLDVPAYGATYLGISDDDDPTTENIIDAIREGRTYFSMGLKLDLNIIAEVKVSDGQEKNQKSEQNPQNIKTVSNKAIFENDSANLADTAKTKFENGSVNLGDTIKAGKNVFVEIDLEKDNEFCKTYGVKVEKIRLTGTALNAESAGDSLVFVGKPEKGFFIIEVIGEAGGVAGDLLISSPIYVE